jgi:hypothetical protein
MSPPRPCRERRLLQISVAVLALVPIAAGFAGVMHGIAPFDAGAALSRNGASHVHYLSGLLLAIGIGFWSTLPRIDSQGPRFRVLALIVVVGGLARLYAATRQGPPAAGMAAALVMELAVTPMLALWRERLERRSVAAAT